MTPKQGPLDEKAFTSAMDEFERQHKTGAFQSPDEEESSLPDLPDLPQQGEETVAQFHRTPRR